LSRLLPNCLVVRIVVADPFFMDLGLGSPRYGVGTRLICRGVLLHVAEVHEGGLCWPHGEIYVLGLHDATVEFVDYLPA